MGQLPLDRTLTSSPAEHLADHLDLHAIHNIVDAAFSGGANVGEALLVFDDSPLALAFGPASGPGGGGPASGVSFTDTALTVLTPATDVQEALELADAGFVAKTGSTSTGRQTFAQGLRVTDDDPTLLANALRGLCFLEPPSTDDAVNGLIFKNPGGGWGIGQDYSEGQYMVHLSDSVADGTVIGGVSKVITAVSNTTPVRVTAVAHGAQTGDVLRVTAVGITALDGGTTGFRWWKVTRIDADNVDLDGSVASGAATLTANSHLAGDPNPVMRRDVADGSIGLTGGIHLALGLRGHSGHSGTWGGAYYGMHIDPAIDAIGLWIDNPTTTEWIPTPTSPFLHLVDTRSSPSRALYSIEATGVRTQKRQSGAADSSKVYRLRNDADSADIFFVRADGGFYAGGPNSAIGTTGPTATITLLMQAQNDSDFLQYLVRRTGQTGDLTAYVQSDFANKLSRFDKNGYFGTFLHSAPADGDVATGELKIWFDQTIGATKAMFKGKDSGGTVRTATVAMA